MRACVRVLACARIKNGGQQRCMTMSMICAFVIVSILQDLSLSGLCENNLFWPLLYRGVVTRTGMSITCTCVHPFRERNVQCMYRVSVSRAVKPLVEDARPPDYFSQKACHACFKCGLLYACMVLWVFRTVHCSILLCWTKQNIPSEILHVYNV